MYIFDYDILLNKCVQYSIILKGIMVEVATKTIKIEPNQIRIFNLFESLVVFRFL